MPEVRGPSRLTASSRVPPAAALALSFVASWLDSASEFGGFLADGFVYGAAAVAVALAMVPRRIAFGAEGLRVAWLWRSRFVPYSSIAQARPLKEDVQLNLEDGSTLTLRRSPFSGGEAPVTVLERLWTTVAAGAESGPRPNERAALARAGRAPKLWLASLRSLLPHGAAYRQGLGLDLARLWAIIENPAVEVELRGAAAIAVAAHLDATGRARLRELAAMAVEPRLRTALERVARADQAPELEDAAAELISVR